MPFGLQVKGVIPPAGFEADLAKLSLGSRELLLCWLALAA